MNEKTTAVKTQQQDRGAFMPSISGPNKAVRFASDKAVDKAHGWAIKRFAKMFRRLAEE